MGGRNTETRRRPCLAVDGTYSFSFTTHICTYVQARIGSPDGDYCAHANISSTLVARLDRR